MDKLSLEILCQDSEGEEEFFNNFYDDDNKLRSLIKYKLYHLENKRGQDVNAQQIFNLIEDDTIECLHNMFQELFLEYVPLNIVEIIHKHKANIDYINRLLVIHNEEPVLNFMTAVKRSRVLNRDMI